MPAAAGAPELLRTWKEGAGFMGWSGVMLGGGVLVRMIEPWNGGIKVVNVFDTYVGFELLMANATE